MKRLRNPLFLGLSFLASLAFAQGQTVFYLQDNFDHGTPYQDNAALPLQDAGAPYPEDGYWNLNVRRGGRAPWLSTDYAQSGTRSVALTISPDTGQGAQQSGLTGFFSPGGGVENRVTPVDAMRIRFAFFFPEQESTASTQFVVRRTVTPGENIAIVNLGGSQVTAQFTGGNQTISETIARDQWYFLEIDLPANPQALEDYTVRLFGADGVTSLGSITGSILNAMGEGEGYAYFVINHFNLGGTTSNSVYLDTFSVQVIPEAETYGLILGVCGILFWLARRKIKAVQK